MINYTQRWCSKFNAITRGEQDSDCKVGEVTYLPDMTRPFEFCVPTGISRLKPGRNILMSRRSIVSLAATVMIGSACLVTISNDAAAYSSSGIAIWQPGVYRGGVYRGGGYRGAYYRGACYRGAVGAAAVRAYYARRC